MKKIVVSLSIIAVAAAIAIGGTVAYFSDTETSTGNVFTAGTLDLLVDNECSYNEEECVYLEGCGVPGYYWDGVCAEGNECYCAWDEKDLTGGDLFFNFDDVKPGDWGEDTISLHVVDNDAWVCATLGPLENKDNGCNEPERKAEKEAYGPGNATCDGDPDGELGDNLFFIIWADYDCNNILDGDEFPLTEGPANGEPLSGATWTIADSTGNVFYYGEPVPLEGCETYCLGVIWYVPSEVGNIIQSDSVSGNISFYAEQARNNPDFVCGGPE